MATPIKVSSNGSIFTNITHTHTHTELHGQSGLISELSKSVSEFDTTGQLAARQVLATCCLCLCMSYLTLHIVPVAVNVCPVCVCVHAQLCLRAWCINNETRQCHLQRAECNMTDQSLKQRGILTRFLKLSVTEETNGLL